MPVVSPPPSSPRVISQSNAAAFILRPIVQFKPGSPPDQIVVAHVSPLVGPRQQVSLLLNQFDGSPPAGPAPPAFSLPADPHDTETDTFVFNTTNFPGGTIPPGNYLARVRVDDAESLLETDPSGKFAGPIVML